MQNDILGIAENFLQESAPLMQRVNELSLETANELYGMLNTLASALCTDAKSCARLRTQVCAHMDALLDRLADLDAPIQHMPHTGIYTPAVHRYRRWQNVELLKDKGLVGYMLAKELKAKNSVMLFADKKEEYNYLEYLPNLKLLFTDEEEGRKEEYYTHLKANYPQMDILILHGIYNETMLYLNEYRKLRPDGKVFCGLDMNSYWMENIDWENPGVKRFALQCNVIATSCRGMRDALNANPLVPFACRFLPNGFYNAGNAPIVANAKIKENIILTVGRIGQKQKNNEELVLAFAAVAEQLPDWKVKLVGSIEPDFDKFLRELFDIKPGLKHRIIPAGAITDKELLYSEYAKAKVFALTSRFEGGAPNVYAEALVHGCMFVTSNIDAASDITNNGELGESYAQGDTQALAGVLVNMCSKADESACKTHIEKAKKYARKYYSWPRNARKLALALARAQV